MKSLINWLRRTTSRRANRKYLVAWRKRDKEDYDAWCKAGSPSIWGNTFTPLPEGTKVIFINAGTECKIEGNTVISSDDDIKGIQVGKVKL